jgi:hypothetical protein
MMDYSRLLRAPMINSIAEMRLMKISPANVSTKSAAFVLPLEMSIRTSVSRRKFAISVTSLIPQFSGIGHAIFDVFSVFPKSEKLGRPNRGPLRYQFRNEHFSDGSFFDGLDFSNGLNTPFLSFTFMGFIFDGPHSFI